MYAGDTSGLLLTAEKPKGHLVGPSGREYQWGGLTLLARLAEF